MRFVFPYFCFYVVYLFISCVVSSIFSHFSSFDFSFFHRFGECFDCVYAVCHTCIMYIIQQGITCTTALFLFIFFFTIVLYRTCSLLASTSFSIVWLDLVCMCFMRCYVHGTFSATAHGRKLLVFHQCSFGNDVLVLYFSSFLIFIFFLSAVAQNLNLFECD